MADWEKRIGAITLMVGDRERAKTFYREVFGLRPQHEDDDSVMFRFKDMYLFLHQDPAHQPPAGAVIGQAQQGVGQFAIIVEDVDAVCAEVAGQGVMLISGPADRGWGMRTATFADPGGYIWEIAQELP